jgi:WD40 repeat protein
MGVRLPYKILDGSTGEVLKVLGHRGVFQSWCHNGRKFASAQGSLVLINDAVITSEEDPYNSMVFHNCNNSVSVVSSININTWNALTGELLKTKDISQEGVFWRTAWSPDSSKMVVGLKDSCMIKIWDEVSGEWLKTIEGVHSDQITALSWSHDNSKIVSGSNDKSIKIWDATTGQLLKTVAEGLPSWVRFLAWNHDSSKILSLWGETTITIWDEMTVELPRTLKKDHNRVKVWGKAEEEKHVNSVLWSHDGKKIHDCTSTGIMEIRDESSGDLLLSWNTDMNTMNSAWNHDSTLIATGSLANIIKIWDALTGSLLNTLNGHSSGILSISWNQDSSKLVSLSSDNTIKIWDSTHCFSLKADGKSAVAF